MQNSMQTFLLTTIIMFINSLRTSSFRNLADAEINTHSKDVFLVGENGQGKTNFLEALYFCAYASSFRTARDSEIAKNGEYNFSAAVKLSESVNDEVLVKLEKSRKSVFINGKKAEDRKELLAVTPTIIFCHEDMEFINGLPERRRWFFDQTLSLYDPVYLDDLRRYKKILKTRNSVLRENIQGNGGKIEEILDALDPQLAEYGQKLMEKRIIAVCGFSLIFSELYEKVSGINGINIKYTGSWKNENNILEYLMSKRSGDMAAGISLSGPHRDKYVFVCENIHGNHEFTGKASTGQKRLLALLLRTAQARRFSEVTGNHPVLLLDDVLLEMDSEKRRRFLEVLPAYSQAFYTFLPDEPYNNYRKTDTLVYKVKDGVVSF